MAGSSTTVVLGATQPRVGTSPKSVADLGPFANTQLGGSFSKEHSETPRRNKITFAPSASPQASPSCLRRVNSSPGNLHRMAKNARSAATPADVLRGFAINALAVGLALIVVCNAKTIAEATLPAGTFAAAAAAVATASESAAAAVAQASESAAAVAADARYTTEESGARVGKSLLRLSRRGGAERNESETLVEDVAALGWEWSQEAGVAGEGAGEVGVLIGALAVLLVCLLGIRQGILQEHRAYEEHQANAKAQRAMASRSRTLA